MSKSVDLSKYEYASIINNENYSIPTDLMEYEIELYDAVEQSNLNLIGELRIRDLTPEQQSKLLIVKYGVDASEHGTSVSVNFIDYLTGRPMASCRSHYSSLIGNDVRAALKKVGTQIAKTFQQ